MAEQRRTDRISTLGSDGQSYEVEEYTEFIDVGSHDTPPGQREMKPGLKKLLDHHRPPPQPGRRGHLANRRCWPYLASSDLEGKTAADGLALQREREAHQPAPT